MQQLLSIHTTQGLIDIHSRNGHFEKVGADGSGLPKLEIQREKGKGLSIEHTPSHMESNIEDVLNSVKPFKMSTIIDEYAAKGKEDADNAAGKYAEFGWEAMSSDPDIAGMTSQEFIFKEAEKEFGLDFTPKTQLEAKYTPSKVNINYERDKLNVDVKRGTDPYKFVQGGVEISLKQKPEVTIEYIGGLNLFPTGDSSKGANIDRRV